MVLPPEGFGIARRAAPTNRTKVQFTSLRGFGWSAPIEPASCSRGCALDRSPDHPKPASPPAACGSSLLRRETPHAASVTPAPAGKDLSSCPVVPFLFPWERGQVKGRVTVCPQVDALLEAVDGDDSHVPAAVKV